MVIRRLGGVGSPTDAWLGLGYPRIGSGRSDPLAAAVAEPGVVVVDFATAGAIFLAGKRLATLVTELRARLIGCVAGRARQRVFIRFTTQPFADG